MKVFCWINNFAPGWLTVLAMDEEGVVLGNHISSTEDFAKYDISRKTYPEGSELVWVDDPKTHEGLMAAYEKNQKRMKEKEAEGA